MDDTAGCMDVGEPRTETDPGQPESWMETDPARDRDSQQDQSAASHQHLQAQASVASQNAKPSKLEKSDTVCIRDLAENGDTHKGGDARDKTVRTETKRLVSHRYSMQKIGSVLRDAKVISSLLNIQDFDAIYNRVKELRNQQNRTDLVLNEILETGTDGLGHTEATPVGGIDTQNKAADILSDVEMVKLSVLDMCPGADVDPNEIYHLLDTHRHREDRTALVRDVILKNAIQEQRAKQYDNELANILNEEQELMNDMEAVLARHPAVEPHQIFRLMMTKFMNASDRAADVSHFLQHASGDVGRPPVTMMTDTSKDALLRETDMLSPLFPNRDKNEIYAYLEAHFHSANRVQLVTEELLHIEQTQGHHVNTPVTQPSGPYDSRKRPLLDKTASQRGSKRMKPSLSHAGKKLSLRREGLSELQIEVQLLHTVFPDCDPNFLSERLESMAADPQRVQRLSEEMFESPDYPKLKDVLKRENRARRLHHLQNQTINLKDFTLTYPDLKQTFECDKEARSEGYQRHSLVQLMNDYPLLEEDFIEELLESHNGHYYVTKKEIDDALLPPTDNLQVIQSEGGKTEDTITDQSTSVKEHDMKDQAASTDGQNIPPPSPQNNTEKNEEILMDSSTQNSTETTEQKLTESSPQTSTETTEQKLTESFPQNNTEATEQKLKESSPQKSTETTEQKLTESIPQTSTETTEQKLTESCPQTSTETTEQKLTESFPQTSTETTEQKLTESFPQNNTETTEQKLTEYSPQTSTETTEQKLTESFPQTGTETTEQKLTESSPQNNTETNEQKLTESSPQTGTETTEQKLPESFPQTSTETTEQKLTESSPQTEQKLTESSPQTSTETTEQKLIESFPQTEQKLTESSPQNNTALLAQNNTETTEQSTELQVPVVNAESSENKSPEVSVDPERPESADSAEQNSVPTGQNQNGSMEKVTNIRDHLMTDPRSPVEFPEELDEFFFMELLYVKHKKEIDEYLEDIKAKQQEMEDGKAEGKHDTCECCYEYKVHMVKCQAEGEEHWFCAACLTKMFQQYMAQGRVTTPCLMDECDEQYSMEVLRENLPSKYFSHLLQRIQEDEIRRAQIEDLVSCPFCSFATIMTDPNDKVFKCLNPECYKESCRLCREPSHIPLRCEEIKKQGASDLRSFVESRMTEAMIRSCWRCKKPFFKTEGCNMMTCGCGASMCYICSMPLKNYDHFDQTDCELYSDVVDLHIEEMENAALKAKQEWLKTHPEDADAAADFNPLDMISKTVVWQKKEREDDGNDFSDEDEYEEIEVNPLLQNYQAVDDVDVVDEVEMQEPEDDPDDFLRAVELFNDRVGHIKTDED